MKSLSCQTAPTVNDLMILKCLIKENKLLQKKLLLVEILAPNNSQLYQEFSYW